MDPEIELPPSIQSIPPPGMGLVEELDKLLMVQLRDGKKLIGIMRSFDQFANIVLEGACWCSGMDCCTFDSSPWTRLPLQPGAGAKERIIVGHQFGEVDLGLHLVRGENVVLLGEVDEQNDPPSMLERVSEAEIKQALKAEQEADKMKGLLRTRFDFLDGME